MSKDFLFVNVPQTDHAGMIDVSADDAASPIQRKRAARLDDALGGDLETLREKYPPPQQFEDPDIKHAVFVLHGIRDFGEWTTHLAEAVRRQEGHVAITSSYGYFPMARFLLFGARKRNVRWFMDEYTQVVARYPQAEISYIGHSNGTYLLASALEDYRSLKVKRVLFAGSVVRSLYGWDHFIRRPEDQRQVEDFRNVVSSADWVVGIFPRFFEVIAELTPVSPTGYFDIGAAGFRGFTEREYNVEFVRGGHGAAIDTEDPQKVGAIIDFIHDGDESGFGVFRETEEVAAAVGWLSKLCWLVVLMLLGGIVWIGYLIKRWVADSSSPWLRRSHWAYGLFVLALLYTV